MTQLIKANLPAPYTNAGRVLDIVVKKGEFDLDDLKLIWENIKSNYENIKKVNIEEF